VEFRNNRVSYPMTKRERERHDSTVQHSAHEDDDHDDDHDNKNKRSEKEERTISNQSTVHSSIVTGSTHRL